MLITDDLSVLFEQMAFNVLAGNIPPLLIHEDSRIIVIAHVSDADFLFNVLQGGDAVQRSLHLCHLILVFLKYDVHLFISCYI